MASQHVKVTQCRTIGPLEGMWIRHFVDKDKFTATGFPANVGLLVKLGYWEVVGAGGRMLII